METGRLVLTLTATPKEGEPPPDPALTERVQRRAREIGNTVAKLIGDATATDMANQGGALQSCNSAQTMASIALLLAKTDITQAFDTLAAAERCLAKAMQQELAPAYFRDTARQEGTQKPRGSRMPILDDFIRAALEANPKATSGEIWASVPSERDDFKREGVYRDGNKAIQYRDDTERAIGRNGFDKRVTKARKPR